MSHVHDGPLSTYNSLTDTHLAGYFANNRMRRHLRKAGLVSKRGEIVSESTYRLNMSRREHKKHVKDMLAQAIVHKTLDMERSRQAEIKRKLEEIAKMQLVRRVRASTSRKGDEDILPILTPRSSRQSPSPTPRGRGRRANDVTGVLYLDDEGRPITPAFSTDRRNPEQNSIDSRHLHSLDTVALRKYAQLMAQMEEGRGMTSPYMMPQVPLPPRPPSTARTPRSARRAQSASPRRVVTTDSRLARLHRPETAKSHAGDQQTLCRVSMKYHGWALNLAREKTDHTQEVVIEQQHCGGNTLTVFKERLEPGTKFQFISYRHRGYPFSLSLYVDGQMDSRVSTCCEYRHSRGAKIGGKQGHFSLLKVTGAVPCYKCQVAKGVRVPSRAPPRKLKRPAEVRREEVIVVSTKRDQKDKEEIRHYEQEMMDDDNDDDDVEMIPVEPDEQEGGNERDEVDTQLKTAQSDYYADDFDDSQASERSRSPSYSSSSSESESETEPKEEENRKKEPKQERATETFQPREDRGEEEEEKEKEKEEEEEQRGAALRGRSSARSPRVEVNGTGRQIDDYSSDDDDEEEGTEVTRVTPYESTKVVSVADVDAEHTPIRSHRRVSSHSSSSSSSSATADNTQSSQGQRDAAVISVDLLDKEEKKEEEAQKERERKEELRRKEETELYQQKRTEEAQRREERKRAEEERRQEDLFRQQQRDEERRRREEQRQQEAEKEKQRREEEEENRRRQAEIEDNPEAREKQRMEAQFLRDEQIRKEQKEREEKRKLLDEEREKAWKAEQAQREKKIKVEAEDRERRRQEEASSSARSETSTARSTTTASSATSSAETTPRNSPSKSLTTVEVTRAASPPTPEAAVYEDRPLLKEPEHSSSTTPQRPTSPLPPAATYESRRRERTGEQEASAARPVSPFPPAAVYEDRRAARKAEKEERDQKLTVVDAGETLSAPSVPAIPLGTGEESEEQPLTGRSSTTDVSTAATSDDDSDDDDDYHSDISAASQESVFTVHQFSKSSAKEREQSEDSGTADSSSDSDTSSDDNDARTKNVSASSTTETADVKEGKDLASGVHATSESDGENMHGGADPDNVAQQEEAGELQPLMTKELPAAKAHSGDITDLLSEAKDSVDLSNVLLNKTQVYQLGSHLEGSSGVKMVSLCNTGLDDDDLQRLSEALAVSPSDPVMLNLSLNAVTPKGIQHVLHVLKAKPSIKLLILQGNPIGDAGVKELTQGLSDLHRQARAHRKAVAMEVTSDTMSVDSSSSALDPSAMAQRYLLQELDLTDTKLTDNGAAHLAQMVASNVYVENVNLSHNSKITAEEGWRQLGEALARNRCIRTLTLDGNRIGDEGISHLARGLQNNRALRSLALEDAGIGSAGGESLMEMLKRNTTILELTLSPGNSIPSPLADDIGKYVALNRAPYGHQFGM